MAPGNGCSSSASSSQSRCSSSRRAEAGGSTKRNWRPKISSPWLPGVDQAFQADARVKVLDGPPADDGGDQTILARQQPQGGRCAGVQAGRRGISRDRHQSSVEVQKQRDQAGGSGAGFDFRHQVRVGVGHRSPVFVQEARQRAFGDRSGGETGIRRLRATPSRIGFSRDLAFPRPVGTALTGCQKEHSA